MRSDLVSSLRALLVLVDQCVGFLSWLGHREIALNLDHVVLRDECSKSHPSLGTYRMNSEKQLVQFQRSCAVHVPSALTTLQRRMSDLRVLRPGASYLASGAVAIQFRLSWLQASCECYRSWRHNCPCTLIDAACARRYRRER